MNAVFERVVLYESDWGNLNSVCICIVRGWTSIRLTQTAFGGWRAHQIIKDHLCASDSFSGPLEAHYWGHRVRQERLVIRKTADGSCGFCWRNVNIWTCLNFASSSDVWNFASHRDRPPIPVRTLASIIPSRKAWVSMRCSERSGTGNSPSALGQGNWTEHRVSPPCYSLWVQPQ